MSAYLTWIASLDSIKNTKEKTILELGLGEGTKILIEKFKMVYSFEVVKSDAWYKRCVEDYKSYSNWKSMFHSMSDIMGLDKADEEGQISTGKTRNIEPMKLYFKLLEEFVSDIKNINVALVDPGFHLRCECVNDFIEKEIPIIIAHDTQGVYGYEQIKLPSNYTTTKFTDTTHYLKI